MSWFSEILGRLFPKKETLDEMAESRGESLDYQSSVVDLLKALGKDSSFEARRDLARQYGKPEYSGTAEENNWLHREIMKGQ